MKRPLLKTILALESQSSFCITQYATEHIVMQDRVFRVIEDDGIQYTKKDRISLTKTSGEIGVNCIYSVLKIIPMYSQYSNIY